MVSADDYGIAYDGSVDVRGALQTAINAQPPGTTFTLHPDGLYLTTFDFPLTVLAPGVTIDGQGATIFRNVRRTQIELAPTEDMWQLRASGLTVRNLRFVGFRKDEYTGNKLTATAGSPTVVDTTVQLATAGAEVRLPVVGLDQVGNPKVSTNSETPYYARQVDGLNKFEASLSGTGGAGDALFCIYDDDTNTLIHSQAFSPIAQATFTITFDPTPANLGTRMRITVKKVNASGVLTVHSITPYGECGYRRADTPWFTGGNEAADALQVQDVVGTLIEDIEIEGPDGDGINCAVLDTNTTIRRVHVRGEGRQAFTTHRSVNYLLEDSSARECGRSGIDYEPNNPAHTIRNSIVRRVDFLNVRNYAIAIRHWAKVIDGQIEDVTSTNCGMGGFDGGGRPMTVTNYVHQGTYRTEADRVLNGGHAGVDASIHGIGMEVNGFTTEFGIHLPDLQNKSSYGAPLTEYHPHDIHVHDAVITAPYADPYIFIDVPNSTVELLGGGSTGTTSPQWDDVRFNWDDDTVTWDGLFIGSAPAFQDDAFQFDAFQTSIRVTVFATQTMPVFTQASAAFVGHIVTVEQTIAAFTQSATVDLQAPLAITQSLPAFSQAATGNLTVRGTLSHRAKTFQDDAFQLDAFQAGDDTPLELPTFTQHLSGAVVPHGSTIGAITQQMAAFTQAAVGELEVSGVIAQTLAAFVQSVTADIPPEGTIAQTVPAFTQSISADIIVSGVGIITQTLPAFRQSLDSSLIRWPEWETSSGSEWLVTDGEEWLVRQ